MTNSFFSPVIILLIAGCIIVLIAKLLKVEKFAVWLGLVVAALWLALYFTGYDKTLYHIIFEAPPVEPKDYRYR